MDTSFYIVLNIQSGSGYEVLGKFNLGKEKEFAFSIFHKLKGNSNGGTTAPLQMDFIEARDGLPVHLEVLNCSLNELSENCKLITKEVFKMLNLENIS